MMRRVPWSLRFERMGYGCLLMMESASSSGSPLLFLSLCLLVLYSCIMRYVALILLNMLPSDLVA